MKNFFTSMAALAIVVYFVLGSVDVAAYTNFLKVRTAQAQGNWTISIANRRFQVTIGAPKTQASEPIVSIVAQTDAEQLVLNAANEFGVSPNLALALMAQESGGNPNALSPVGATGIMQVMPATGAGIAQELGITSYDLTDPATNVQFGMYYLNGKLQRYGHDWGLAAYNWGPGAVDMFLERHPEAATMPWDAVIAQWGGEIPAETQNYVASITALEQQIAGQVQSVDIRQQLVDYALSLQGLQYVYGGRSTSGADCSGTMQLVYLTVTGKDIGATTFSQFPALQPIGLADVQPGDLWYGQYTDDQHVGMVADVNGDGKWDLINNGGLADNMHVDYDFLAEPYFNQHTMGFRRAF